MNKLQVAFGPNIATQPLINKSGSLIACYEACKFAEHIGCVHWTEDDLRSKFKELDIPATKEIFNLVKSSYLLRHIGDSMVELGWKVIEQAIVDAQSVGSKD